MTSADRKRMMEPTRGAVLAFVVLIAILCSIAAYAVLMMARAGASRGAVLAKRQQSMVLAEAGLVIAMQKLAANPNYPGDCAAGPPARPERGQTKTAQEYVDTNTDGAGAPPDPTVRITVTNCGERNQHKISATVTY